jgi:hypothetical protein
MGRFDPFFRHFPGLEAITGLQKQGKVTMGRFDPFFLVEYLSFPSGEMIARGE